MNNSACKLGDITLSEIQKIGFKNIGAFVDAWIDTFGYWDPQQKLQPLQMALMRRTA